MLIRGMDRDNAGLAVKLIDDGELVMILPGYSTGGLFVTRDDDRCGMYSGKKMTRVEMIVKRFDKRQNSFHGVKTLFFIEVRMFLCYTTRFCSAGTFIRCQNVYWSVV